jgi:NAD+ synthase
MTVDGMPGEPAAPAFPLPAELAIDTAIARRVIGEFIRGQLAQAGFERAVLGLSGGIDSALVAYLVSEAIGADRLLCVLMPYRTSSPASRHDAEEVVRRLGCAS